MLRLGALGILCSLLLAAPQKGVPFWLFTSFNFQYNLVLNVPLLHYPPALLAAHVEGQGLRYAFVEPQLFVDWQYAGKKFEAGLNSFEVLDRYRDFYMSAAEWQKILDEDAVEIVIDTALWTADLQVVYDRYFDNGSLIENHNLTYDQIGTLAARFYSSGIPILFSEGIEGPLWLWVGDTAIERIMKQNGLIWPHSWQADSLGCNGYRSSVASLITQETYDGGNLSKSEVQHILGKPNWESESQWHYWMWPANQCADAQSTSHPRDGLVVTFDNKGLAKLVQVSNEQRSTTGQ